MLKVRVIPTLLWKQVGLVKGIAFDSWRRVGSVLPAVKVYNLRQVDELVVHGWDLARATGQDDAIERLFFPEALPYRAQYRHAPFGPFDPVLPLLSQSDVFDVVFHKVSLTSI